MTDSWEEGGESGRAGPGLPHREGQVSYRA